MGSDLVKIVKRANNNPAKDSDLNALGTGVANIWLQRPEFTLLWITPPQHKTNVTDFGATLTERMSTGGGRKEITKNLADLDDSIDQGIISIKSFLAYKYTKNNAPSYYPQFGIVRQGKNFVLPRERNRRKDALTLIVAAVATHVFTDAKYDAAFWQATKQTYETLLGQATNVDGAVSQKVSDKNELRKTIVKTHNALIRLLQANYPDTYKSVIREWGFQKEKY